MMHILPAYLELDEAGRGVHIEYLGCKNANVRVGTVNGKVWLVPRD